MPAAGAGILSSWPRLRTHWRFHRLSDWPSSSEVLPSRSLGRDLSAEQMAELFVAEINEASISATTRPTILRSKHRAGVIKVATSGRTPYAARRQSDRGCLIAHRQTGAPILTHTEQGTGALNRYNFFETWAPLCHMLFSPTPTASPMLGYHKEIPGEWGDVGI